MRVLDILPQRVLVTRESARKLNRVLAEAMFDGGELSVDFEGIEGLTPSFLDELMIAIGEQSQGFVGRRIRLVHPPTRLSAKFRAVGRVHGLEIHEAPDGWIITQQEAP